MKLLQLGFLVTLAIFAFSSCSDVRKEYSPILAEQATVMNAVYTPRKHDTNVGVTIWSDDSGILGIDHSGNFGINLGGVTVSESTVREKFAIVFKCQHGQFVITRKSTYEKLKDKVGDTVTVLYREVYRTTYKDKKAVKRVLVDYDFLETK